MDRMVHQDSILPSVCNTELSILTNPLYKATKISLSGLPVKAVGDVLVSLQHRSVSATDGGWDILQLTDRKRSENLQLRMRMLK